VTNSTINRAASTTVSDAAPTTLTADHFRQTVDRALIHREALGEVFLTDVVRVSEIDFAAAAQLPRSHAYYGDHAQRVARYDPLLLLEASRQTGLAIAHRFCGVPFDYKFILTRLAIRIEQLSTIVVNSRPGQLMVTARIIDQRTRDGMVTGLELHIELTELATGRIGSAHVGLRFRSSHGYHELRSRNRGGAALPSTATYQPSITALPAIPAVVGRKDPRNVIVSQPTTVDGVVVADVLLPTAHPSMFDHPQDHIPGMVLIEAARQVAIAGVADRHGFDPSRIQVIATTAEFTKFAELEPTTRLIAMVGVTSTEKATGDTQAEPMQLEQHAGRLELPVAVELYQAGDVVCRVTAVLRIVSTDPRED
jgi:hypothetical protein